MSHRTKLAITAVFLVLLGICAWHLILTWRPHEPLRFRLVRQQEQLETKGRFQHRVLEVEVENTSSVPIHLDSRVVIYRKSGITGSMEPIGQVEPQTTGTSPTTTLDGRAIIIPAGGRWRGRALARRVFMGDLTDGNTFLRVSWMSRTRSRIMDIYWPLAKRLPMGWQHHLPSPAYDPTLLPLDTSAP